MRITWREKLGSLGKTSDPNLLITEGRQIYEYIPIDFIKCQIINFDKETLLANSKLNFVSTVNEDTGEIKSKKRIAYYKNFKIVIYESGYMQISGSLHVYYNEAIHNYNQFTHQRYLTALNRMYDDFKLLPCNLRILNLEYGVNIEPPIKTQRILDHCFLHKKLHITEVINDKDGHYKQANHKENYILKMYDKAKQYQRIINGNLLNKEIFRIEIKQMRWGKFRDLGINTMDNFNKFDKSIFVNDLINKWNEVIFYDPERTDRNFNDHYLNTLYWMDLVNKNPKTYYKHTNKLKEKNRSFGKDIQNQISEIIRCNIGQMNAKNTFILSSKI